MRPEFVDLSEPAQLSIEEGRHPVLDAALDTPYVTNDTTLSNADGQYGTQIITGPNMGGQVELYTPSRPHRHSRAGALQCHSHLHLSEDSTKLVTI